MKSSFYLCALSLFAGSGFGTIAPDPDPGKCSGATTLLTTHKNNSYQEVHCFSNVLWSYNNTHKEKLKLFQIKGPCRPIGPKVKMKQKITLINVIFASMDVKTYLSKVQ